MPSAPSTEPVDARAARRGRSTTAPAPSPNRMHVLRSVKSRTRERTSAPITSTVSACARLDERGRRRHRVRESRARGVHVERRAVDRRACAAPTRRSTGSACRRTGWRRRSGRAAPAAIPAASRAIAPRPRPRDRRSARRRRRSGAPRCPCARGSTRRSCRRATRTRRSGTTRSGRTEPEPTRGVALRVMDPSGVPASRADAEDIARPAADARPCALAVSGSAPAASRRGVLGGADGHRAGARDDPLRELGQHVARARPPRTSSAPARQRLRAPLPADGRDHVTLEQRAQLSGIVDELAGDVRRDREPRRRERERVDRRAQRLDARAPSAGSGTLRRR